MNYDEEHLENVTKDSEIVDDGITPTHSNSYNQQERNSQSGNFTDFLSETDQKAQTLAIVALVVGILGILCACCMPGIGFVLCIGAIVCGVLSKYDNDLKDMKAILGIILGLLGIVLNIIAWVVSSLWDFFVQLFF